MAIPTLGTNVWFYLRSQSCYETLVLVALLTTIYVSGMSFLVLNLTFSPSMRPIPDSTYFEHKKTNMLSMKKYALLAIYRVTLHPLAKYPGDFIDKITNWRLIYYCYSGDRHLRIIEAHKKYGI